MGLGHAEIFASVQEEILSGRRRPGEQLPTDQELAESFSASRATVQRAMSELARSGLVRRAPRWGTRVADPSRHIIGQIAVVTPVPMIGSRGGEWLSGISERAREAGYCAAVQDCQGSANRAAQIAKTLIRDGVSGVIWAPIGVDEDAEIIRLFNQAGVPVICWGRLDVEGTNVSYMTSDNRHAGELLARHLISKGHQRIATIAACHTQEAMDQRLGILAVYAESGFPVDPSFVIEVRDLEEIQWVVDALLKRPDAPTVIHAVNDLLAAEVMAAIDQLGKRVPDDCAVVGVGDEMMSKALLSPLTTCRLKTPRVGRLITSLLLNIISGKLDGTQKINLEYELIVRRSCGMSK